jgi:hypothetical protein
MSQVGQVYRKAGVAAIYLVHGTFVGLDALGLLGELGRMFPSTSRTMQQISKRLLDRLAADAGNYTEHYAQTFEASINRPGAERIAVHLFHWSSQNSHIGRADAAVRLIEVLAASRNSPGSRVLLWGHSHAGNVFALLTNLLAADAELLDRFFDAARIYYRWPLLGWLDVPVWKRAEVRLRRNRESLLRLKLDLVTFGTPIRYGWDSNGYAHLLHFIYHRPAGGVPCHLAPFPPTLEKILRAADGDYVQQCGIAGTNLSPSPFAWRNRLADRRLNDLLQPQLSKKDLFHCLQTGARVPDEGTTLLVDYGPAEGNIAHHMAGHAVYTEEKWLLFHAEEIARFFYEDQPSCPVESKITPNRHDSGTP